MRNEGPGLSGSKEALAMGGEKEAPDRLVRTETIRGFE